MRNVQKWLLPVFSRSLPVGIFQGHMSPNILVKVYDYIMNQVEVIINKPDNYTFQGHLLLYDANRLFQTNVTYLHYN